MGASDIRLKCTGPERKTNKSERKDEAEHSLNAIQLIKRASQYALRILTKYQKSLGVHRGFC